MDRAIIQKQALDAVDRHRRAGLSVSMGVGKTYIGLQYIERFYNKMNVLVVAPKRDVFQSWIDDANKFSLSHLLPYITFSTYISLHKQDPELYGVVVLDEAHNTKDSHRPFLEEYRGRILGLTGTPPKWLQSEKGMAMQDFYPIVYSYKTEQAVTHNILNDYRIFIHSLPLSKENTITTSKGWKTSERKNYDWLMNQVEDAPNEKQRFFKRIMVINALKQYETKEKYVKHALTKINAEEKCLIFANTIPQAELLCKYSHHSKKKDNSALEAFKLGTITRLSAVEQLSEGINIPNLKHIIVMHSYGNERRASQKIGRALRLSPDQVSTVHILMYRDTIDEKWVQSALEGFNKDKIKTIVIG